MLVRGYIVTSQKEHLQTLIAEIDAVLQRTNPRLPWVMSGEVAQQRQVLERVRNYLVALQQRSSLPTETGQPVGGAMSTSGLYPGITANGEMQADLTPYQMLQTILQEVSYLRTNLPQPGSQPPLNQPQLTAELLQVLMSRLQENLSQQIAQTLEGLRQQSAVYGTSTMLPGGSFAANGPPAAMSQYEHLQTLRSRSDQMLVNLDSTLNLVFESLQRNIQAYQESLSQGVERMYNMGQQSEYTFKALLDQLAQQLKQEASAYLLSSSTSAAPDAASPGIAKPNTATTTATPARSPIVPPSTLAASSATSPAFPYAGAELLAAPNLELTPLLDQKEQETFQVQAETPLDSAIESWLQAVGAMNRDDTPVLSEAESPALPALDLSDLELGNIDLDSSPISPQPELSSVSSLPTTYPNPPALAPTTTTSSPPAQEVDEEDTAEIDAALKLLEEISAELDAADSLSLAEAEAQLKQMLDATDDQPGMPPISLPDDARDELDEFYQSLFGSSETTPDTPATDNATIAEVAIANTPASAPFTPSVPDQSDQSDSLVLDVDQLFSDSSLPAIAATTVELPALSLELPADLFDPAPSTESVPQVSVSDAVAPDVSAPDKIAPPPASALKPDEMGSLTDLFQDVPETAARSVPVEPPSLRRMPLSPTVAPVNEPQELFLSDDLFGHGTPLEPNEDQFTRAAPEEVLLPEEVNKDEREITLELDDLTLSSLSEDLSSLEGYFDSEILSPSSSPSPLVEPTLQDFAVDLHAATFTSEPPAPVESPAVSLPVSPSEPETPEILPLLEDLPLAENLPALDNQTRSFTLSSPSAAESPFYQASSAIADLSLNGLSDLFGDIPPPPTVSLSTLPIPSTESFPFTLEGTHDLFEVVVEAPPASPEPSNLDQPSPFTLEGMDDIFGHSAPANSDPATIQPAPPTQPAPAQPVRTTPHRAIPPFKPEQFTNPDDVVEALPPFQLERLDNLFVDAPSAPDALEEASTPAANPNSTGNSNASPVVPDKRSLDAALESLLGTPPASAPESSTPPIPQKKKTL